jgi:hypothetical protein
MKMRDLFQTVWAILCIIAVCIFPEITSAQPDPGMNGDSTLVGGGPISGGVPLGSGLLFFLLFGAGYGIRKWIAGNRDKNS